jgi:hypothetical protein
VELILYLDFYKTFMLQVRNGKTKPGFNNMEQNIDDALDCLPTRTELCAAAIYCELVDRPYNQQVRAAEQAGLNLLNLGPLHQRVLGYCKQIETNPDIILAALDAPDDSALPCTFDGKPPARPHVLQAVAMRSSNLPHLKTMVVAFFKSAQKKWVEFTQEFDSNEKIASMSPVQRRRAFLHATNDRNEGALGRLRVLLRRNPNMSLRAYNARTLIKYNQVVQFLRTSVTPEQRALLRKEARRLAVEQKASAQRLRLAEMLAARAKVNAQKAAERVQKHAARLARENELLAGQVIELDVSRIGAMKGQQLDVQIKLIRRLGLKIPGTKKSILPAMSKLKISEKQAALALLVTEWGAEIKSRASQV